MNATHTTPDPYRPASLGDFPGFPVRAGDLAYVDTFSGLVPCRVDWFSGWGAREDHANVHARVTFTGSRGAYTRGESISARVDRELISRASVRTRAGQLRVTAGTYAAATTGTTRYGKPVAVMPDGSIHIDGPYCGAIHRVAEGFRVTLYSEAAGLFAYPPTGKGYRDVIVAVFALLGGQAD